MQQWSSTALIARANKFLDSLELPQDEPMAQEKLAGAIKTLTELKGQMLFHAFNAPFLSLLAQSRSEFEEMGEGDSRDLAKQLVLIRDIANSKKLTLNRVRVALNACRMASESLEDGDNEFARVLPIKGDYLQTLIEKTDILYAYYPMMEVLERERGNTSKVVFTVSYKRNGKPATAKFSFSQGKDIEGYVKHVYGESAKVTESKVMNVPELLVKKRSVRICLAIAYAKIGYMTAMPEIEKAAISGKLERYSSFMRSKGLNPTARLDLAEGYESEKAELVKNGFATKKGDGFSLDEEISLGLAARRKALRSNSSRYAKRKFAMHLLRHFLLKSKSSRESSTRLPSIRPGDFELLPDILSELKHPPFQLQAPHELIARKLSAEEIQPKIDSRVFGSAFVFLTTDKDAQWCSENLAVGAEEMKKAAMSIAGLIDAREDKLAELGLKKRSGRAAEFTELVRGDSKRKEKKAKGKGRR